MWNLLYRTDGREGGAVSFEGDSKDIDVKASAICDGIVFEPMVQINLIYFLGHFSTD